MATQHPDNASAPWWKKDGSPFVSTQDEIKELITLFAELPIDEYMWDWEGKHVDEAVGEKIFSEAEAFFRSRTLGKDVHLTYRIPAYEEGKMHRTARAFMNMLSMSDIAKSAGFPVPAVKEMFLPMTTKAEQIINVRSAFLKVADYHSAIFHQGKSNHTELVQAVEVTPLVEDTKSLFTIDKILRPYWESLLQENKDLSLGQRVFLARSDPAMNAGLVPAVLSVKSAIHTAVTLGTELGFTVFPVIGTGSLPFRGSVNPLYIDTFLEQYAGVRTYSIQSAFRYDFRKDDVDAALRRMKNDVPEREAQAVSDQDKKELMEISALFEEIWRPTIEALAARINRIATFVPNRRERLQHIGLFGYSRGVGSVTLPRAIKFTGALYSIGIPPELIATGRGLKRIAELGKTHLIDTYYPALRADLEHAGKYLNRENVEMAAKDDPVFRGIQEDIEAIDAFLGTPMNPWKPHHMIHRNLTSTLFHRLQEEEMDADAMEHDIVEAAKIRRSLG